jgi:NadR type nicotinamide-nucleotide adenylyltransferase
MVFLFILLGGKFMSLHGEKVGIVFGCYAPMHQGHLDVIFKAKKECEAGVIIIVCGSNDDRGAKYNMPLLDRYNYIKEFFKDDELVNVYMIDETYLDIEPYPYGWDKWLKQFENIYQKYDIKERVWYVGEEDYVKQLEKRGEKCVYLNRDKNKISATLIRSNPNKYWNKIIPSFRHIFSHNILITGTASEGKSTLINDLAKYFNTASSVEFGKEDLIETKVCETKLTVEDYKRFLYEQYNLTIKKIKSPENRGIFFGDTDNLVTRMYAKYYSNDLDFDLTECDYKTIEIESNKYNNLYKWDKIFIIYPNGKFVDDGIRYMKHSHISIRKQMYEILCSFIKEVGLWDKVTILNGNYYENFISIVEYVKGGNLL